MQVHVQRALTVTVTAKHQQQSGLRVAETLSASSDESSQEPLPLTVRKSSAEANWGKSVQQLSQTGDIRQSLVGVFRQHRWFSAGPTVSTRSHRPWNPTFLKKMWEFCQTGPIAENDRLALLTNLELELNEQEHQWQTIRHTMHVRDSLSTVGTSPSRDSRYGYGSARLSKLAQQRGQLDADYDILALFPQADSKFMNSLATPTPPDTDEESEYAEDHEEFIGHVQISPAKTAMVLWRPIASVQAVTSTSNAPSLWTPAPRLPRKISPVEIAGRAQDFGRNLSQRLRYPVTDCGSQCLKSKPKWWKLRSSSQNLPATPRVASNVSLCCQISWRVQNHSLIGAGHLGSSNSHGVIGQTVRQ
ncbi:hypothetical protein LB503_010817 [Fusarium chuoi]|nr:hypothetical protein LB503_010817 [Fusarium chuoi]